jgi:hypothetical protein
MDAVPPSHIPQDIAQDIGEGLVCLESELFPRNTAPPGILTSGMSYLLAHLPQDIVQYIGERLSCL